MLRISEIGLTLSQGGLAWRAVALRGQRATLVFVRVFRALLVISRFSPLLSAAAGAFLALELASVSARAAAVDSWVSWVAPELRTVDHAADSVRQELASLGAPVVGQTVAEFGYQLPRLPAEPPTPPWVQIDLGASQRIDTIALVPAQVDWQPLEHQSHAFPRRFRVDVSDDPSFATFTPVGVFTDSDVEEPGIAPVVIPSAGVVARYVRLTVTKLAEVNGQHFFALAELMVLSGRRNVAIGRPVSATDSISLAPRWSFRNLVDGRTPLGPPVQRDLQDYDGLYAGPDPDGKPLWMKLDLQRPYPLNEVRLHPIHARFGADVPGFAFPARFRVEASLAPEFSVPTVLFESAESDYPNPGNNPVTIPISRVNARFVRVTMLQPSTSFGISGPQRFGLSEIEVFADGVNVARTGTASATPDTHAFSQAWPVGQLNDGYASYGRILDLPEWLALWQKRTALLAQQGEFARRRTELEALGRRRLAWLSGAGIVVALGGGALWTLRLKRRRAREQEEFRRNLARDLHDEIGSNLAGLALLSEAQQGATGMSTEADEDWKEVNRIARETTDAMREVLWLMGAREESGGDLSVQLRRAAERVLPGKEIVWVGPSAALGVDWPQEHRRQVFLFCKEALANVARHARASRVEFSHQVSDGELTLSVLDNGDGFDAQHRRGGLGLESLHHRARAVGGSCTIVSRPGEGTRVTLRLPLPTQRSPDLHRTR